MVVLRPVAGVQLYVLAPLAVTVVLEPRHTLLPVNVIVGLGLTVTVLVAVLVQPVAVVVPVTVYIVVTVAVHVTLAAVDEFNPVAGDHT